jgi:hypothetical protein
MRSDRQPVFARICDEEHSSSTERVTSFRAQRGRNCSSPLRSKVRSGKMTLAHASFDLSECDVLFRRIDHYLRTRNRRMVVSPDRLLLSGSSSVLVMPGAEKRTPSPSSTGNT